MAVIPQNVALQIPQDAASKPARLHYLDWLRVIAIVGVILYHAARPFIIQDWLIMNDQKSDAVTFVFLVFLGSWGMPLFFMISGIGSYFALQRRTARQYAGERLRRLFIPLVVGCLVLSPIQFYLEWLHKGWYQGDFFAFLPLLLQDRLDRITTTFSPSLFESLGSHLWFLGFLLTFSLIGLPIFVWFKNPAGRRVISRIGSFCQRRGGLFIFIIPVALTRILLQGRFSAYTDWADFSYMLVFFICGFILFSDERLIEAIRRDGKLALLMGILSTAAMLIALAAGAGRDWVESPGTPGFYMAWTLASINGWCWTIAMLSLGMRLFSERNRWLDYGQEAIVPVYLFHQPLIVLVAFYVVRWPVWLGIKLLVIVLASFALTLLLYEFLVRRVEPARAFFGMKPRAA